MAYYHQEPILDDICTAGRGQWKADVDSQQEVSAKGKKFIMKIVSMVLKKWQETNGSIEIEYTTFDLVEENLIHAMNTEERKCVMINTGDTK